MTAPSSGLTPDDRRFLDGPRLGFLTVPRRDAELPTPVPVWFESGDSFVQLFAFAESRKVKRIAEAGHASLVAANHLDEPEHWIAVAGRATIETDGAFELAVRLATRYRDLSDPVRSAEVQSWGNEALVRIVVAADNVRRYGG
jgi:Pyridoxamine 5'-phosphate oxidase